MLNIRILLSIIIAFICGELFLYGQYMGDITITTQQEIRVLSLAGNSSIQGNVTLEGIDTIPDEWNNITRIEGNLVISNTNLDSITNLRSLIEVTGDVQIASNRFLSSLYELNALTTIGGDLTINSNSELLSLSELNTINSFTGNLTIQANRRLKNLQGLSPSSVQDLVVSGDSIETLTDLSTLTQVGGDLLLQGNGALVDLSGLENLTQVMGNIRISSNDLLSSLTGLSGLSAVDTLILQNNQALTSLSGMSAISSVTGNLVIQNNHVLNALGLTSLASVTGDLIISENSLLGTLDLSQLDTVGGKLTLLDNSALTNIVLPKLASVGDDLTIESNKLLKTLSGLDALVTLNDSLTIQNNEILYSFCGLNALMSSGWNKEYTVSENLYNPTPDKVTSGTCEQIPLPTTYLGSLYLTSQQDVNGVPTLLANKVTISGNLYIGTVGGGDITDLSPLSMIDTVMGDLFIGGEFDGGEGTGIHYSPSLSNLSGLIGLKYIGGDFYIERNDAIGSLPQLELNKVLGSVTIANSAGISNLVGLEALQVVGEDFTVEGNDNLVSMNGLTLTSITGGLIVERNPVLENLDGFSTLTTLGGDISIQQNEILYSFCGLNTLKSNGWSNGYTVESNLYNPPLNDLVDGLCIQLFSPNTYLGSIYVTTQNEVQQVVTQLQSANKTNISGGLYIGAIGGGDITDLAPLGIIDTLFGSLYIGGTYAGKNRYGEHSNPSLDSLSGLDIVHIGGGLHIHSNEKLAKLKGLESLSSLEDSITITNNGLLSSLCGLTNLIKTEMWDGQYTVENNRYNPSKADLRNDLCQQDISHIYMGDLYITTQSQLERIELSGITEIQGDIFIGSPEGESDPVDDLTPLQNIKAVTGSLTIGGSYNGGNEVVAHSNPKLIDLSGLGGLMTVNGGVTITNNDQLTSLLGLEKLNAANYLNITNNKVLSDFCALNQTLLNFSFGFLGVDFKDNYYSPTLDDLKNNKCSISVAHIYIGNLYLTTQTEVNDFANLTGKTKIFGNVYIGSLADEAQTDPIVSLAPLSGVDTITGELYIGGEYGRDGKFAKYENSALKTLSGLESLSAVEGGVIQISSNRFLYSFCALNKLIIDNNWSGVFIAQGNVYNPQLANLGTDCEKTGELLVVSGDFHLGTVFLGDTAKRKITLLSIGDVQVSSFAFHDPTFSLEEKIIFPFTLSAGEDTSFSLLFTPTSLKEYSGEITVESNANEQEGMIRITTQVEHPLSISPLELSFLEAQVGQMLTKTLQITNKGENQLTLNINAPAPYQVSPSSLTIKSGENSNLDVKLTPLNNTDNYSGQLTLAVNQLPNLYVKVYRQVPTRVISLSGDLHLGGIDRNRIVKRDLIIANNGNDTLEITNINYPQGFTLSSTALKVPPNESKKVEVSFQLGQNDKYSGTITIESNKTSGKETIAVSGELATRKMSLSNHLDFGYVGVGKSASRVFKIYNLGNVPIRVDEILLPVGYMSNLQPRTFVEPRDSLEVTITVSPTDLAVNYVGIAKVILRDVASGEDTLSLNAVAVYEQFGSAFDKVTARVLSETCPLNNDGVIEIVNREAEDISVQLGSGEMITLATGKKQLYDGLEAGKYSVTLTQSSESKVLDFVITEPEASPIEVSTAYTHPQTKSLRFIISGGEAPYTVKVGDYTYHSTNREVEISNLPVGMHDIDITDGSLCNLDYEGEVYVMGDLKYYPNPVKDVLTVMIPDELSSLQTYVVQIISGNGTLVAQYRVINEEGHLRIPFTEIPTGVYLVSLLGSNQTALGSAIKIVVE